MRETIAKLPTAELAAWEDDIRHAAVAHEPPPRPFDPMRPVAAAQSVVEDAVNLVHRGVRVAPVAETLALIPLYARQGQDVPAHIRVAHETQAYDFYLVQLTFNLCFDIGEVPDYAEFVVRIEDGVDGARASRTVNVFPQRVHSSWIKAGGEISVALDASLQFEVGSVSAQAVDAEAKVAAGTSVKVLAGPFNMEFGTTELDVVGEGDREVGWIYRVPSALEGKNDFRSLLVLKIARETKKVSLAAKIGVRTYRRSWGTLWLRERMPILRAERMLDLEIS